MPLQLKFDGRETVSGTFVGLPEPGDVKKGTFNAEINSRFEVLRFFGDLVPSSPSVPLT